MFSLDSLDCSRSKHPPFSFPPFSPSILISPLSHPPFFACVVLRVRVKVWRKQGEKKSWWWKHVREEISYFVWRDEGSRAEMPCCGIVFLRYRCLESSVLLLQRCIIAASLLHHCSIFITPLLHHYYIIAALSQFPPSRFVQNSFSSCAIKRSWGWLEFDHNKNKEYWILSLFPPPRKYWWLFSFYPLVTTSISPLDTEKKP